MPRDQRTKRRADQIARDASAGFATKVTGATAFDFAGLDATGDLIDSGYKAADFLQGDGGTNILGQIQLLIEDGTNVATMKCTVTSLWNGDAIGATDNVAKGATTGDFTLNAGGTQLDINSTGLSGSCLMAQGSTAWNSTGTAIEVNIYDSGNGIRIIVTNETTAAGLDITTLVNTGTLGFNILYITNA